MGSEQTITPSIYKIDPKRVKRAKTLKAVTSQNVNQHILAEHATLKENGLSSAKSFHKVLGPIDLGKYKVNVYATSTSAVKPHKWKNLFGQEINGLDIKYPNLAAFISTEESCYAISAGQGHTLFDQYIDVSFPLSVARHIMKPGLNSTERREIAGSIYGQAQQYRTNQTMVSSQTLGTVWRSLKGEITEEIKSTTDFKNIFGTEKGKIGTAAGSSITINRAVPARKIPDILTWIEKLLATPLTEQQKKDFMFLEGLKEIAARRAKDDIQNLKVKLANYIYDNLSTPADIELDFSHKEFERYHEANMYGFGRHRLLGNTTWQTPPSLSEVILALKAANLFATCTSGADVLNVLEKTVFYSTNDDPTRSLKANLLGHLHGEVEYEGQRFFLIDGTWYKTSTTFLKRLRTDFVELLKGEFFAEKEYALPLRPYAHTTEGTYNESYRSSPNWLVGDRLFINHIEIADLFHWHNDKLYVIHVKKGFNVTTRDVCSQVLNSMNVLNRTNEKDLREYYDRVIEKHYAGIGVPITKDAFVDAVLKKTKSNIVYVIAYIDKQPVSPSIRSSIAKFETIKLCKTDKRQFDFILKIKHVMREPQTGNQPQES